MDVGKHYCVADISLGDQGKNSIELAELRMGALMRLKERFKKKRPFSGIRIGMALHITKETAALVRTLSAGGADVAIASCNPLSTQDDVAAALASEGISVFGYKGENKEDYYKFIKRVLETNPNITIDDGGDLVTMLHTEMKSLLPGVIGGCEETTTGILRLRAMEKEGVLRYPMIAVNDNKTKHLFDNYYGTGQSVIDGIIRATNVLFAGKNVVVAGYGDCGKGVALRAKGLGANVIVTEVDPFHALQAVFDGYRVVSMNEAAAIGDVFITVTGDKHVIDMHTVKKMKDGVILANGGHFNVEIDVSSLEKYKKRRMRENLDEYTVEGKRVYLCAEGRLVNLAAAEGHPSEIMSTSFCGQALACEYLVKNKGKLPNKVIVLPKELDDEIARLQLESMGIQIDSLTGWQKKYLSSWREGT